MNIEITVRGGVVQDISGIPDGVTVTVTDWDSQELDENGEIKPCIETWGDGAADYKHELPMAQKRLRNQAIVYGTRIDELEAALEAVPDPHAINVDAGEDEVTYWVEISQWYNGQCQAVLARTDAAA